MQTKVIVYIFNRFHDPLFQSNLFLYLKEISRDPELKITLVTYENVSKMKHEGKSYILTEDEILKADQFLDSLNINWVRLAWFSGKSLYNKFKCFKDGFFKIKELKRENYKYIVALASVAGSFAYIYAKLLRMKLYLYQYEPHSEYQLDTGYFSRFSLGYVMLNFLEGRSARFAKVISSGTVHMQRRLENWKVKATFFKIPSVVDQEKFKFNEANRLQVRKKYNIPIDKQVVLYAGKFGGLYFNEENPRMFEYLRTMDTEIYILIVTLNPIEEIREMFNKYGLNENITITTSSYEDIDKYLSASDFGIVSVESGPSKQFISNIKVGEYLSCGLPYLICRGISEDDWYAENKDVGVVVTDFSEKEIKEAYPKIKSYLNRSEDDIKSHCRQVGIEYRGFKSLLPIFRQAIERLIS